MVHPAIHAEDLPRKDVGEYRDRRPVACNHCGKRPPDTVERQPRPHVCIFINVCSVVEADEIEMCGLRVDAENRQNNADEG